MNSQKAWQKILSEIQLTLSPAIFKTWFKDLSVKEKDGSELTVFCPNAYTQEVLIKNHYLEIIEEACAEYFDEPIKVNFEIKKEDLNKSKSGPLFSVETVREAPSIHKDNSHFFINKKYLFSTFIIGASNNLAVAAARAIAETPGQAYNPFFIYGGVGLGKTHLMCAIGNEVLHKDSNKKILYITSEQFTNELIISIQKNRTHDFREKYRQADVLIIDDVQFFAGKEASQEEFFHTFNALYSENKQIILSSDKPPREINKLEERLVSRFEGGLTVDIQQPDYETRVAILKSKCQEKSINLSSEIIDYIAENVTENIRKLEGTLSQIVTFSAFTRQEATMADVQRIIGLKRQAENRQKTTPDAIINTVCEFYGIKILDVKGKSRKAVFVRPRQMAMYLLKKELNVPLMQIGEIIGNRDHTTVIHAVEQIEKSVTDKNSSSYTELITIKKLIFN